MFTKISGFSVCQVHFGVGAQLGGSGVYLKHQETDLCFTLPSKIATQTFPLDSVIFAFLINGPRYSFWGSEMLFLSWPIFSFSGLLHLADHLCIQVCSLFAKLFYSNSRTILIIHSTILLTPLSIFGSFSCQFVVVFNWYSLLVCWLSFPPTQESY